MAGSSLLILLDDIAAVLDDVATMTKMAAGRTAGVLGDDLAVNAEKLTGVRAERELPVVWAVAKGSLRNKCILVPAALVLSALASWAILPALVLGGLFLCYEGFEKLSHGFLHGGAEEAAHREELLEHVADPAVDLVAYEQDRIKGAIRTDFILSAEIIVLTLGIVASEVFVTQVLVLCGIALVMTVGVYGLVAGIVKLDDAGLYLARTTGDYHRGSIYALAGHAPGGVRPLVDEGIGSGGDRGHVHGRRRHPGACIPRPRRLECHAGRPCGDNPGNGFAAGGDSAGAVINTGWPGCGRRSAGRGVRFPKTGPRQILSGCARVRTPEGYPAHG